MPLPVNSWVILRDARQTHHVVQIPAEGGFVKIHKTPNIPGVVLQSADLLWVLEYDKTEQQWQRMPETELPIATDLNYTDLANNKEIIDDTNNQIISPDEVENMKAEGVSGSEIISALVKGSTTFDQKTPMAQLKWLEKKKRKHLITITILPVTLAGLCEKYALTEYRRSAGLRWDYLYTMIGVTSIRPGLRVLVVDQSLGLLTSAIIDRMAGKGVIFRINGDKYSSRVLDFMNFDKGMLNDMICDVPLDLFVDMTEVKTEEEFIERPAMTHRWICPGPLGNIELEDKSDQPTKKRRIEECEIREEKKKKRVEILRTLYTQGVDVVIAVISTLKQPGASAVEIGQIISKGSDRFLQPDGKLAVFCLNYTIVMEAHLAALKSGDYIAAKLQELFLREHQVLPLRTHPIMVSSVRHFAGFLFSAIKVANQVV